MGITIFIRARNEEKRLEQCLKGVFSQECPIPFDVILLDSGSTDRTLEIAGRFPVKIIKIPRNLFGFSKTLNFGATCASGEYFVVLSAHAVPRDDRWLAQLIAPLISDRSIAASYCQQESFSEESGREVEGNRRLLAHSDYILTRQAFISAVRSGEIPYDVAVFSNTSACYRREILLTHPFRELPYSEDRAIAVELLCDGWSIAYLANAVVYHGHDPSFSSFYSAHRRSAIARIHINRLAFLLIDESPPWACIARQFSWAFLVCLRIFFVLPYVAFRVFDSLVSYKRYARFREIQFNLSALGSSIGMFIGLIQGHTKQDRLLEIALFDDLKQLDS